MGGVRFAPGGQIRVQAAPASQSILCTTPVWTVLKYTVGIRVTEEEEYDGVDLSEFGLHAYPEFVEWQGLS